MNYTIKSTNGRWNSDSWSVSIFYGAAKADMPHGTDRLLTAEYATKEDAVNALLNDDAIKAVVWFDAVSKSQPYKDALLREKMAADEDDDELTSEENERLESESYDRLVANIRETGRYEFDGVSYQVRANEED